MAVIRYRHFSNIIKGPMSSVIVFLEDLSQESYRVIWLCHGGSGDVYSYELMIWDMNGLFGVENLIIFLIGLLSRR